MSFIIYETVNPKISSNYHTLAEAFKNHTGPYYLWWLIFSCLANLGVDDRVCKWVLTFQTLNLKMFLSWYC